MSIAILFGGGLDSAILVAEMSRIHSAVYPIAIRTGAIWESVELDFARRFLRVIRSPNLMPLVELEIPVADLYGPHWSLTGSGIPDERSPDVAVYLPGRNVILLTKSLLWCHLNGVPELATATLAGNPFPDATPEFDSLLATAIDRAVGGNVRVSRPFAKLGLDKAAVMKCGIGLPLELTMSCITPVARRHCGRCNKCAERKLGFAEAGLLDPTDYN